MTDWEHQCVLCAARGRTTRLESGHVCAACQVRLTDHLDDIVRLAALASVEPRSGSSSGHCVPASRPPLNVDGLDPALTLVRLGGATATVLEVLESWTRLVLEARGMAQYGPWSLNQARKGHRNADLP